VGTDRPQPVEETQDDRHVGAVETRATSVVASATKGRQKNDNRRQRRNEILRETHGNRQDSPNGDSATTVTRTGGMKNGRETSGSRRETAAPAYILRPYITR
jgi:hypothetical protein